MKTVAIAMKRGAWINTLRAALGTAETPGTDLFVFTISARGDA